MTVPEIPIRDYRNRSMLDYVQDHAEGAAHLMETVIKGLGVGGHVLRPLLPRIDRLAEARLRAMSDPYRNEILEIRDILDRAGPVTFSLSYEFGCTARVFDDGTLFRTLDWPFKGLGELIEIVHLPGDAGEWVTATWPGVVGCLQGAAPGRFAAALNQAPERKNGWGKAGAWIASKRRFMKSTGMPPPHLLRRVFETAPDFDTAKQMLSETPVAAPVIYTLSGPKPDQAVVIERIENQSATPAVPAAANHFASDLAPTATWRARGYDSAGRRQAAIQLDAPMPLDDLAPPILNPLTRLAVTVTPTGDLSVAGWDGTAPVTQIGYVTGAA